MQYYFVTFTASGGLTVDHCLGLKTKFEECFEEFVGVKEHHLSGLLHMHVWYASLIKQTAKHTQRFERWYDKLKIPRVKGISIKNKKETDRIGLCHYFVKKSEQPFFIRKFVWTWIQEQAREDIKHKPKKLLLSEERIVGQFESVELIVLYAEATGRTIACKGDFIRVVCDMMSQKYRFDKCRMPALYIHTMARLGDTRAAYSWFESELQCLE